jgi:hypothetical protein
MNKNNDLKELIKYSNTEISKTIIEEINLDDILNNFHQLKCINSSNSNIKNYININEPHSKVISKKITKEIIEEVDSFLEENTSSEEDFEIKPIKNIKIKKNSNSNLILKLEKEDNKNDLLMMASNLNKESSLKTIDDIFNFINSNENDAQKYLIDIKFIKEKTLNDNDTEKNENQEKEDYSSSLINSEEEINQNINDKEEVNQNNNNDKEEVNQNIYNDSNDDCNNVNDKCEIKKSQKFEKIQNENEHKNKIQINNNDTFRNINKDEIKSNEKNNKFFNKYENTKINLIEKTESFTFLKEKEKIELKQYLNNKQIIESKIIEDKNKNTILLYEIIEFYKKDILLKEFDSAKISALYLDDDYIYVGDDGGNLIIYNLKDEILLKRLNNPFSSGNNKKFHIKSIYSNEHYIMASYEKGKIVIFIKNDKNVLKTKIFESFDDVSQEDIIEAKFYEKKNNNIIIYFADYKENIFRIKLVKNKIFKNKIIMKKITTSKKNSKKIEPYYHIEINPFNYKCIGVINNVAAKIYIIKKFNKNPIFTYDNMETNSFKSFCFSSKKEEKNKFFISHLNKINIYELNNDFDGVCQLNTIILEESIIHIDFFQNGLISAYTIGNNIKLINYNNENNEKYKFPDIIPIDENSINRNHKNNADFLTDFQNHMYIKDGKAFIYYKHKLFFFKTLPFYEGLNKLYNFISGSNNIDMWEALFDIILQIFKNNHPLWQNTNSNKFNELCISYTQIYISLLIVQIDKINFNIIKNKFNKLIQFLSEINFYDYIIGEKNSLYSIFIEGKLANLYYFLLEPYIIEDKFINMHNKSFIKNLIISSLDEHNQYITKSSSWLNELLLHFSFNNIIYNQKEIIENFLINVIISFIMNYDTYLLDNCFIDLCTPLYLIMQLLQDNKRYIDLSNDKLFIKENRYKDEIILSNDYLRLKYLWYIVYILKNKIINEKEKIKEKQITAFIKEISTTLLTKNSFDKIVFNESNDDKNNNKSNILCKEVLYVFQIILDNTEALNKFYEINKDMIFQKIKELFDKRKEIEIDLKIFILKNILKENISDIENKSKLDLILYFMENSCQIIYYPELKTTKFENNLIEILKSIDSFTFIDIEKLLNYCEKCKDNYKNLVEYILLNFKKD